MALEIEKKFLINSIEYKSQATKSTRIKQGYISSMPERTVRVRIKGDLGFITIKGKSSASGVSRYEWEKEIPISEVDELLLICENGVIDKTRYEIKSGHHIFEVDEFYGDNQGLVVAEVELSSENEDFIKPLWLGEEITGDKKYYNSMLMKNPFSKW